MEKSEFLALFLSHDKLCHRKAEVLDEFVRLRPAYRHQELSFMVEHLVNTDNAAKVETLWRIATNTTSTFTFVDKTRAHVRISGAVSSTSAKPKLRKAPGYGLMRMLKLVCSKKFVERELVQTHADGIFELFEAEKAGDKWLAASIPWRLRAQLLIVTAGGVMGWFFSKVKFSIGGKSE